MNTAEFFSQETKTICEFISAHPLASRFFAMNADFSLCLLPSLRCLVIAMHHALKLPKRESIPIMTQAKGYRMP